MRLAPPAYIGRRMAPETALVATLVDMEMAEAQTVCAQAPARLASILLRTLLRALPRMTVSLVMLVDMELLKARLASAQAPAKLAGILLRILLRVLPRLTALAVMLVNTDKLARPSVSIVTVASIPLILGVHLVETATLDDMEMVEARMPNAQARAKLAGILLRQLLRALPRLTALAVMLVNTDKLARLMSLSVSIVTVASIPLILGVQLVETATLDDMGMVEGLTTSARERARLGDTEHRVQRTSNAREIVLQGDTRSLAQVQGRVQRTASHAALGDTEQVAVRLARARELVR
jgi:hypothetical protein